MRKNPKSRIAALVRSFLNRVWLAFPAVVVHVNRRQFTVSVQLLAKLRVYDEEVNMTRIDDIPVLMPHTQKANIVLPVNPGDIVLCVFCTHDIAHALQSNSPSTVIGPKFDINSCVAIPGLWTTPNKVKFPEITIPRDRVEIHGTVHIVGDNIQAVARHGDVTSAAADGHTHTLIATTNKLKVGQ